MAKKLLLLKDYHYDVLNRGVGNTSKQSMGQFQVKLWPKRQILSFSSRSAVYYDSTFSTYILKYTRVVTLM
jgi:hypothetical protein